MPKTVVLEATSNIAFVTVGVVRTDHGFRSCVLCLSSSVLLGVSLCFVNCVGRVNVPFFDWIWSRSFSWNSCPTESWTRSRELLRYLLMFIKCLVFHVSESLLQLWMGISEVFQKFSEIIEYVLQLFRIFYNHAWRCS